MRRLPAALTCLLPLLACGGGGPSGAPASAASSTVAVDPPAGLGADGTEVATITVTVRDATGAPLAGRTVELSASGAGNLLAQPAGPTDASGTATGTLATTAAERKTVTAVVDPGGAAPVALDQVAETEFVWSVPGTYYVRASGSDASTGRSPASAWRTLAHAAAVLQPGERVLVGAGTYTGAVTVATSGLPGVPLAFVADRSGAWTGDAGEVVVDGVGAPHVFHVDGADHVRIEGFTLTGALPGTAAGGAVRVGSVETSESVTVVDCTIHGNGRGVDAWNAYELVVEGCRISNNAGPMASPGAGDAIRLGAVSTARIYDNLVYNNSGHGLRVEGPSIGVLAFFNTFHQNGADQVSTDGSGNELVLVHDVVVNGFDGGIDVAAGDTYVGHGNLVFGHFGAGYAGVSPDPSDVLLDPAFADPSGPDGMLGGAEGGDDAFQLDPSAPSPAIDAGVSQAENFVLTDGTTMADLTTQTLGGLDGTADGALANLGYHYPAPVDALAPLAQDDARATFARGDERQALSRVLDAGGAGWLPERRAPATGRRIRWVRHRLSPLANDEELLGQLCSAGGGTELELLLWNGASWQRLLSSTAIAVPAADQRGFDLAFEQASGDVLAVYSNGTADPVFVARDAGAWSAAADVFAAKPTSGTVLWVELVPRPGADEVALVYLDDQGALGAVLWDGDAWDESGTATLLATGVPGATSSRPFDAAWESASGELLVAWGGPAQGELGFASWSPAGGGAWSSGVQTGTGTRAEVVRLAAEPGSDRVAAVASDGAGGTGVAALLWDGGAWTDALVLDSSASPSDRDAAVAWLGASGTAVLVYADDDGGGALDWATWSSASGWGLQPDAPLPAGDLVAVELRSLVASDRLVALLADDSGALRAAEFDGLAWSLSNAGAALEPSLPAVAPACEPFDLAVMER